MADIYMNSHGISGPGVIEPVAANTRAVEAFQRAHEPDLVLEADARRIARDDHPRRSVFRGHDDSLRHLTSGDVAYR